MVKESMGYLLFNFTLAVTLKVLAKVIIEVILFTDYSKVSLIKAELNSGMSTKWIDSFKYTDPSGNTLLKLV